MIRILFSLGLIITFLSCNKNDAVVLNNSEIIDNVSRISSLNTEKKIASRASMSKLAKCLALALNDKDFQKYISNEQNKKWGGDLQFLINDHYKDNIKNKSLLSHLLDHNLDIESVNEIFSSHKIRLLATENTYQKIAKLGILNLLVVIDPFDEKAETQLEAYDLSGKKIMIDAKNEPSNPVLVVGSCEICNEEQANKITKYEKPLEERRTNGYGEYFTYLKTQDVSYFEGWTKGAPEMYVVITVLDKQINAVKIVHQNFLPDRSRSSWNNGIDFGNDPAFQNKGYYLFNWYYLEQHGNDYIILMYEDDGGATCYTQEYTFTFTNPSTGVGYSLKYTGKDNCDEQAIYQGIGNNNATPQTLNTGHIICTVDNKF